MDIMERGNSRFIINIVRAGKSPEETMLDMLSDVEAWLRAARPHYRNSFSLKTKAKGARENIRAAYILAQQFFRDCEDQGVEIPNSALLHKSLIERALDH